MITTIFGFTLLISLIAPISQYLMVLSGLGGMYGVFWKQFPPAAYISTTLILHYVLSFGIAYLLVVKLKLKKRIPSPLAGKYLIWVGGVIMIAPSFLRIFTSLIPGGGASFALMSISAPFIMIAKAIFFIGIALLLLAIKPNGEFSYPE